MILYQNVFATVLLNAFPFMCVLAIWSLKFFEHLLPTKQQEMLERCVRMAVTMAEQSYDDYGPLEKKQIALRAAIDLFHAFHLPVPQPDALNTAIEASVFAVHQAQVQTQATSPHTVASASTMHVPVVAATPAQFVSPSTTGVNISPQPNVTSSTTLL